MTATDLPQSFELVAGTWGTDIDRDETYVRNGQYSVKMIAAGGTDPEIRTDFYPFEPELCAYQATWIMQSRTSVLGTVRARVYFFKEDLTAASTSVANLTSFSNSAVNTWERFGERISSPPSDARYMKFALDGILSTSDIYIGEMKIDKIAPWWELHQASNQSISASTWTKVQLTTGGNTDYAGVTFDSANDLVSIGQINCNLSAHAQVQVQSLDNGSFCQLRIARGSTGAVYEYGPQVYNSTGGAANTYAVANWIGGHDETDDDLWIEVYHDSAAARNISPMEFSGLVHII